LIDLLCNRCEAFTAANEVIPQLLCHDVSAIK